MMRLVIILIVLLLISFG
ncbi:type I toxin-antitoxin system toxin IbsC, partial [Escherichia coli]